MMTYIQTERLHDIEKLLKENHIVKISQLVKKYDVSSETIRRDLTELERRGVLRKVHGGAISAMDRVVEEPPFQSRKIINLGRKKAIAREIASLIKNGESLILDVGTTVQEVARCLVEKSDLFVVTNSAAVASILSVNKSHHLVMLGGELRADEFSTYGSLAIEQLQRFTVEKAILGAGGITASAITDFHFGQAVLRREMINRSKAAIFAVDSGKFGIRTLHHICKPTDAWLIVTDEDVRMVDLGSSWLESLPLSIARMS